MFIRDAYNGSLLWQLEREGTRVRGAPAHRPDSRYAMFVDNQRLYLQLQTEEYMKSYDLFTGQIDHLRSRVFRCLNTNNRRGFVRASRRAAA